jgi:hypothetical protein
MQLLEADSLLSAVLLQDHVGVHPHTLVFVLGAVEPPCQAIFRDVVNNPHFPRTVPLPVAHGSLQAMHRRPYVLFRPRRVPLEAVALSRPAAAAGRLEEAFFEP